MERDVDIARHVVGEAATLGRTCNTVDETCPMEAILDAVRKDLGLSCQER